MNFRQLEIFRAVVVSGSASRAAVLLQITQPAVSRALGELEGSLGFFLFNRVKGRLKPTPECQIFFREVDASFSSLDSLRSTAARIRDFGTGRIRIASMAAYGSTIVPKAIKAFQRRNPRIPVTFQIMSSSQVRDLIAAQQFDVGIAADEVNLAGVESQAFATYPAVCAIPPGHAMARNKVIHPKHLHDVPFVALAPEDRARKRISDTLRAAGVSPNIVVETPGSATVCALVLEGVGVGLVNLAATAGYLERGLILRPFKPEIEFRSHLLFQPGIEKPQLVRQFVHELMSVRDKGLECREGHST